MNKKLKLLTMCIMITTLIEAKSLSIDEAINVYYKNSLTTKNIELDKEIRDENRKDLLNEINRDLSVSADTSYSTNKDSMTLNSKVSYKDAYISLSTISSNSTKNEVTVGVTKKLNEFLYNTDKAKIYSNEISNLSSKLSEKKELQDSIASFGDDYLALLNKENTIKSTEILIKEKNEELEIAKIKFQNSNFSSYDLKVIELSIEELNTKLEIALIEKQELEEGFRNTLGIEEEVEVTDVSDVEDVNVYRDESSIKILENQIELAKDELKGLKTENLPQLTAGASYAMIAENATVSLGFLWSPLDYKGDEKAKELNIKKLENQLNDTKKTTDLAVKKIINNIDKLDLNMNLSKKTYDLAKLELEKYKVMKDKGTLSEYDYFDKQKNVLDDEIDYLNSLNSLNMAKKLQNVYSSM